MQTRNEAFMHVAPIVPPGIRTGLVLNEIYKVGSLIEEGPTCELYEGTEVSTGDRVSLKMLLPQLAADPETGALFLAEARFLMRLSHPGLLQYRSCARDPQSDLSYIVMDSVGPRLSTQLASLKAKPRDILALTKRLALALAYAHRAGLIHGHLSPRTVVLLGGGTTEAAIIGFSSIKGEIGSASDRVNIDAVYCAPEQLAIPCVETAIGPWTDIYSLALVILATARGQHATSDLSFLPRDLRPVFSKMLQPDSQQRLRSMDDVVELLHGLNFDSAPLPRIVKRFQSLASRGRKDRLRLAPMAEFATKMFGVTGAARRGSLAAAALLTAATPWLLQTSIPQTPADARAASVVIPTPQLAPTGVSAQPAVSSRDVSTNRTLALAPEVVPLPIAKPTFLPRARPLAVANGNRAVAAKRAAERLRKDMESPRSAQKADRANAATDEAERTARLNAVQMRSVTSSTDQVVATNGAEQEPAGQVAAVATAADQAVVETRAADPAAAQGAISQPAGEREGLYPPLLQSALPRLAALAPAPTVDQGTAATVKTSNQTSEQEMAANAAAERAKASAEAAERRLRQWCKAQRRVCTFPTRP